MQAAAQSAGGGSPEQAGIGRPGLGSARDWIEEQARDSANSLAEPVRGAEVIEG